MGQRLYVKNVPWDATEDSLSSHFEKCGPVSSVTIIRDRETGRSKGFCFVEMENAQKAIETLNEVEFEGRVLMVSEARPRENRGGGNRQGGYENRRGGYDDRRGGYESRRRDRY